MKDWIETKGENEFDKLDYITIDKIIIKKVFN